MNLILKAAVWGAAVLAFNASADDLGDSTQILCSTLNVNVCQSDGACAGFLASDLNVPQFIEIDTKSGKLATTAASGENRETAASQAQIDNFHKAFSAGLEGKDYIVKY